jgi:hypothetical protein
MDSDSNQMVSRGEFLKYFQKITVMRDKVYPIYKEYEKQSKA